MFYAFFFNFNLSFIDQAGRWSSSGEVRQDAGQAASADPEGQEEEAEDCEEGGAGEEVTAYHIIWVLKLLHLWYQVIICI